MIHHRVLVGLAAAILTVSAFAAPVSVAQAQPYPHHRYHYDCRVEINRAEARLDRAIRRHGRHSPEARHRRHELQRVRERCRYWRHHHHYRD